MHFGCGTQPVFKMGVVTFHWNHLFFSVRWNYDTFAQSCFFSSYQLRGMSYRVCYGFGWFGSSRCEGRNCFQKHFCFIFLSNSKNTIFACHFGFVYLLLLPFLTTIFFLHTVKDCRIPMPSANMVISFPNGTLYGAKLELSCQKGWVSFTDILCRQKLRCLILYTDRNKLNFQGSKSGKRTCRLILNWFKVKCYHKCICLSRALNGIDMGRGRILAGRRRFCWGNL